MRIIYAPSEQQPPPEDTVLVAKRFAVELNTPSGPIGRFPLNAAERCHTIYFFVPGATLSGEWIEQGTLRITPSGGMVENFTSGGYTCHKVPGCDLQSDVGRLILGMALMELALDEETDCIMNWED